MRELTRRAREGDLLAACALERELARAGGERSFDAHGLLNVLREDGREVRLELGDVTLTARRREERAILRACSRSPRGAGLPKSFTLRLAAGWTDEQFVAGARRLYRHAVEASRRIDEPRPPRGPSPADFAIQHERAHEMRRRASFLRRML